jgi:hypothetical protein
VLPSLQPLLLSVPLPPSLLLPLLLLLLLLLQTI